MTNNFELYKEYITSEFKQSVLEEGDTYFVIELIRRGKDHPDKPAANYHFKNYYIRKPEDLDKYAEEIVGVCNLLGLRAYASINYKSFRQVTLNTITELAHRVSYNDYNKSYAVFDSCSSKYCNPKNKRWIIDIDNCHEDNSEVQYVKEIINKACQPVGDKVLYQFPTKSGIHLVTKPFNRIEFDNIMNKAVEVGNFIDIDIPEIKKNHLTLLYENIG